MSRAVINSGQVLADIAGKYEDKQDWHNALEAHKKAAAHYERALSNEHDAVTRQTLTSMKSSHEEKMKAISSKLNQSPENVFDMKKLEQELFAIQKGGAVGDPSVSEPPLEDDDDEDDGDPFNRFWGVVEPMVNKLSQAPSPGQPAAMSDTVFDEAEINRIQHEMSFIDDSFFTCPTQSHQDQTTYTQSDQNPVIKAMPDPNDNPEEENRALKAQIADIKSEIQSLQQKSVDSTVLKSSIIQFKKDVHKQALRVLQTQESAMMTRSAMTTGSAPSRNVRHVGTSTAEIMNRIRELEEANKVLRSQNRKQDALMNKYRERWEKLKEGAKKRQPSSLEAASNGVPASSTTTSKGSTLLSNLASANPPSTANISSSTTASTTREA
ncbi:hypothetical protein V8B55DRAFT_1455834 [Mucor lusitanicus]|uniref:Uncharacterized protein n=1 Tax=Mucor circinelloides f. lusitanicus TaxID=29924 RepID=A0A8H4F639_MUCCL|nr:hypothetical protein FB192DRAFT_1005464 [Mucor lusitanicus]